MTEDDSPKAEKLLQEYRDERLASKPPILRLHSKAKTWSQKELLGLLEKLLLQGRRPLGVMEYLLSNLKNARSKDKPSKPKPNRPPPKDVNTLLALASSRHDINMVYLFSKYADQRGLDSALNVAVLQRNMDSCSALLESGADPTTQETQLIKAISSADTELITLLCSTEKTMVPGFLETALEIAILRGSLKSIIVLLKGGAKATTDSCLKKAMALGRPDIMAALILSRDAPSSAQLDCIFGYVYKNNLSRDLMEIILLGGASGIHVNQALVEAAKLNDRETVRLLIEYHASVDFNSGEAIIAAINLNYYTSVGILLGGDISPNVASHVLSQLPHIGTKLNPRKKETLISSLIGRGADAESIAVVLTSAIKTRNRELIIYLVSHNAAIDYHDGEALRLAMRPADPTVFDILLQCKPNAASLNICMSFLFSMPDGEITPEHQLTFASRLLKAGAAGTQVNEALLKVSAWHPSSTKNQLIWTFIQYKADVKYKEGSCFGLAAEVADLNAIYLLHHGHPTASCLSRGILPAVHLTTRRHRILDYLISIGACGPETDEAFLILVREETLDLPLIAKLLGDGLADPNVGDAYALERAVDERNLEFLQLLADARPKTKSLNKVFPKAVSIPDKSVRYETCRILLETGANGVVVASALLETQLTRFADADLFMLLIKHGADLNYQDLTALRRALAKDDVKEFALLLSGPASCQLWSSTVCTCFDILTDLRTENLCPMATLLVEAIKYHSHAFQYANLGKIFTKAILKRVPAEFLNILLTNAVDTNYQNLPLQYAVQIDSEEVFDMITSYKPIRPTPRTIDLAFKKTWALKDQFARVKYVGRVLDLVVGTSPCSRDLPLNEFLIAAVMEHPSTPQLVDSLVEHGASVHFAQNKAFIDAASHEEVEVLELLLKHANDPATAASTFKHILVSNSDWMSEKRYALVKTLLGKGVPHELLDEALSQVSQYGYAEDLTVASFVDLLLQHGADPNCQNGQALQAAIVRDDVEALKPFLLSGRVTKTNLTTAFAKIFDGTHDEVSAFAMLEIFLQIHKAIHFTFTPDFVEPVIFTALRLWPQSTRIIDLLLDSDVRPDSTVPFVIDEEQGVEQVSLLLWALLETRVGVSQEVIDCLLEHGGKFPTP